MVDTGNVANRSTSTFCMLPVFMLSPSNALNTLPMRDLPSPPLPMTIIIFCPFVVGNSTYPINSCNVMMSSGSNNCPIKDSHCDGLGVSGIYLTGSRFMQKSFCAEKFFDKKYVPFATWIRSVWNGSGGE